MNSPAAPGSRGAGRRRWQLPADVSGFVGRGGELARLADLLSVARLVTVTGPGGVGKTRLALRAAADAADAAETAWDGSCLIELSGLCDPELLPDTVALRLGLQRPNAAGRLDAVLDELRGRKLLLILDTCEHLIDACARFVTTVLRETDDIKILATSRQPLHVPGEEVLRLGPLPVPGDGESGAADAGNAVELFAQRAAAAVTGFTLAEGDLAHVTALCRRLDGIPLAIELAAVRVRALPIAELAARVEAGLAVGTGRRRGTTSRHQTLHAAIEWSYGLCTDAEKAAWRRLSVFAGTFDAKIAQDVIAGAGLPLRQAGDAISGLVDKSVVLPSCGGRNRLLDSVREFGRARLAEASEAAAYHERHLARYLSLIREFSHRLVADGQQGRLDQLRWEHENLRCALRYGLADPCPQAEADTGPAPQELAANRVRAAARLAAALYPYWVMSGSMREGMHWQDKALNRFTGPSPERASALANRASLGTVVGVPEAVAQATEAIAMAASVGDDRTHARAYLALELALTLSGRYSEALEAAQQARWRLEELGAEHALRTLDMQLALTYVHVRNFDAALDHCQRLLRGVCPGERWLRGNAHVLSALAYYPQPGRQDECATATAAGLRETLEISNLTGEACALEVFAWLALAGTDALPGLPSPQSPAAGASERLGGEGLTTREQEIAVLVTRGLSNREIAARLVISKRTVDAHVNHIFAKLGLSSRVQLTIWLRDRAPARTAAELSAAAHAY